MQSVKYGVGPEKSTRGKNSSVSSLFRLYILIFVRVLENSSQRAYFRSCDENTATPLADKREIGRYYGFPCALLKDLTCMLVSIDPTVNL